MKIRKELKEIETQRDLALSQLEAAQSEIRSLSAELTGLKPAFEAQRLINEEKLAEAEKALIASAESIESKQKYIAPLSNYKMG